MLIAGAGNLGLHTLDQLLADKFAEEIIFFDEKVQLPGFVGPGHRVLHTLEEVTALFSAGDKGFVVAVGQGRIRERLFNRLIEVSGSPQTIISESASFISCMSEIGDACIIQPACAISHNAVIGRSCILHASTLLGHDLEIDDFVTIGSNVNILKGVQIGKCATIGPNVLIYQNLRIGANAYIAPGVIVTHDVADNETLSL